MNVQQLVDAIGALDAKDALQCKLTVAEWKQLAPYLAVRFLRVGEPLMTEGEADRELFILADGELEVMAQGHAIAHVLPGSVVGEGSFFSGMPRSATVVPSKPGVAWGLQWDRFELMAHKHPRLACDLMKGLAAVLAIRMREAVLVGHFA
ncbi:Crp/Fnr family transcriptional regulator [Ramlibacter albus]|uniref:Cyclic nucleotide-binding domain-containing protein n=1 Tax=Ramlibacter albus TaxID=2079448 RepID=A0A923S0Z0_9BURK|nr:cyclic nucleotide-binding domain-containing protein [Ramlibacter albus]MBC5763745.1 cyclic nucleotide-binding domain-containing protein [Ramlibacter albus]